MSKITQYLNEHLLGEVTSNSSVRERFSRDGSILNITPELVVSPRVTNDIRKVARFTWQLAEKGHVMPITVRGFGSDQTGAAIGKGVIINTVAHLNNILYINMKSKDQFVHVQPGVRFSDLNDTLKTHGMIVPSYPINANYNTVAGAVANNAGGKLAGRYGTVGDWVKRLEFVLANGDLIEVSRINRRELDKKKGLQSFEGEIYRKIDGIIEDNQDLIDSKIANNGRDNAGYPGIAKVKNRDGSFDLTPLIIGSQGTLGIISELVLRTDYYSNEESMIVAAFEDAEVAHDAADLMTKFKPSAIELIDGELFDIARSFGKKYAFFDNDTSKTFNSVMFVTFNDISDGARRRNMKHAMKKLSKLNVKVITSNDYPIEELIAINEVRSVIMQSETDKESTPPLIDGAFIPAERREEFKVALAELAKKHHISLPISVQWLDGIIKTYPTLQLHNISDKQKAFKLVSDYSDLVTNFGGTLVANSGEGRLRATAAYEHLDEQVLDIYDQIRAAFDPFHTMNPGVKEQSDLRTLVSQLNPDFSLADFAEYSPKA